jgi:diacylglycerol kinase
MDTHILATPMDPFAQQLPRKPRTDRHARAVQRRARKVVDVRPEPIQPAVLQSAAAVSWRHKKQRSRVTEVADGGAMLFSDVAMVRTLVVVAVMLAVVILARRRAAPYAAALAIAAAFFFLCEAYNTIVEMLVDRISMEHNVFSARIKHSSAFVSAVAGTVAFAILIATLFVWLRRAGWLRWAPGAR